MRILLFILFLSNYLFAQIPSQRTDSLYIIFDFKMTDGIGKSWVKKPNNDEVFSVWNTERDTIVFIKENAIQAQNPYVSKRFLKKQKNNKY
jgi:hypothetical protein